MAAEIRGEARARNRPTRPPSPGAASIAGDGAYHGVVTEEPFERVLTREEFNEMLRDAPPPTSDDVSITSDGRRLDSKEAIIDFFTQLEAELADGRTRSDS